MADYTFHALTEPIKNDSSIQIILDVDALAAPARAALAGYVASLALPTEQTQHLTWENVGAAVLVQSLAITYYLPSLGIQTPAPDTKRSSSLRQRVAELQSLANKFPKCQLLLFARTSAAAPWVWINTEVIQNYGNRVNTLKLVPYLNQSSAFIPGKTTQIGLQFIADPASNSTLPQVGDRITVQGSVEMDVNPIGGESKKNDEIEQLRLQVATLELAIEGRLINLAANSLLGRTVGPGTVEVIPQTTFATPAQVDAAISNLIGGAPTLLNTLDELAQAFNDDPNFAATVTNSLATKAPLNSPAFTGFVTLGDNVAIKKKLLTGTTAATEGGTAVVAHGINSSKIISITGVIFYTVGATVPINSRQSVYASILATDSINLNITNQSANSAGILSKPFYVVIEYVA